MLAPMQYRDFVWPNNPRVFEVEYRRTLHSYKLPFSGYVVQNLGLQNKIIRGEGEFVGPKAYESFRRLAALFEENKGGKLVHPVWPTMRAYFAKLSLRQEPKEDYISYSFEFWEYVGSAFEDAQEAIDDTDYGNPAAVSAFARAFGISSVVSGSAKTLNSFSVRTGESAWSALKRFCRYAWGTVPYFTKSGTLVLNGRTGSTITVDASKDAASVSLCDEHYGIISDISIRNRVTGASYTVSNESFAAFGGKCHREMTVPKTTGADAARYTAEYQIAESKRGKRCVKLTLTKQFACFPGDRVQLTAAKLGVSGTFTVISSHCWADSLSAGTIVTLEV